MSEAGGGPLWKGRFTKPPASSLMELSRSLDFDRRLWRQDIQSTRAHASALEDAELLTGEEANQIARVLDQAASDFEQGLFTFDPSDEDIHSAVERYLTEKLGEMGARIHAGRSRNDLAVTDLRLWLKSSVVEICGLVRGLEGALVDKAVEYQDALAPGYTHLQRAQPVLLSHHFFAHFFALRRDFDRLRQAYEAADTCCLGAAAFAGTTLPLDAIRTAERLGFQSVFENSADAVADRDFALQFLGTAAILGVHLSRLAEEMVLWTSEEFKFAVLDDAYSTGSSIMPQKKNPDVAELVRAKAARIAGNLIHLLGAMKGLPLAYNRDLQEDKEPVFDTADCLSAGLAAITGALVNSTFDRERLEAAAQSGHAGATDLAEALVMKGVAFRVAHEAVGKMVGAASAEGKTLSGIPAERLAGFHPELTAEMVAGLNARKSVDARASHGGTSPSRVADQMRTARDALADQDAWIQAKSPEAGATGQGAGTLW